MSNYCVYKFYDKEDQLLYVGCTMNVLNRMAGHSNKPWARDIKTIKIERHEDRIAAELAEEDAIKGESPIYNKTFNGFLDYRTLHAKNITERNEKIRKYAKSKLGDFFKKNDIRRSAKETGLGLKRLESYTKGETAPREYTAYELHLMTKGFFDMRETHPNSYLTAKALEATEAE